MLRGSHCRSLGLQSVRGLWTGSRQHALCKPWTWEGAARRAARPTSAASPAIKLTRGMTSVPRTVAANAVGDAGSQATKKKVAVAQMTSTSDFEANFATCSRLVQEAVEAGCCMLFLPECFSFIGNSHRETVEAAQPLDGAIMTRFQDLARANKLWLSLGGFQETGPDSDHIFNTHVIVDADGDIMAAYRKIHLFNVDVPSGPILLESGFTAPGSEVVTCDSPAGQLGLSTCYDLRFPELYQNLAWHRGANVLLVPSAFTRPTGEAHWEVLLRARAIECQSYVIAAAQAGRHNQKRESYGDSVIIDPWGTVIARLSDRVTTGIATAELDLSQLQKIRDRMPVQEHRAVARKVAVATP